MKRDTEPEPDRLRAITMQDGNMQPSAVRRPVGSQGLRISPLGLWVHGNSCHITIQLYHVATDINKVLHEVIVISDIVLEGDLIMLLSY